MTDCKSRLSITTRGRLTLMLLHLSLGAAWLSGDPDVRLAAALLTAPTLVDLLWKLAIRPNLALELQPRRGITRQPFTETGLLINRSHRAAVRGLQLREPRTAVQARGGIEVSWLPPGGRLAIQFAARYPRRGKLESRSFEGETEWPFGLFRWDVELRVEAGILSEPARRVVDRRPAGNSRLPTPAARTISPEEDEFWALRELRFGDDARRAHARRSAALGTMVIAVRRAALLFDAQLIVDLRSPLENAQTFGARVSEHRLGEAAWLVDRWVDAGMKFDAHVVDKHWRTIEIVDRRAAREYLEWLATARACAFRPLDEEEALRVSGAANTIWIPAGGYLEPRSASVRSTG